MKELDQIDDLVDVEASLEFMDDRVLPSSHMARLMAITSTLDTNPLVEARTTVDLWRNKIAHSMNRITGLGGASVSVEVTDRIPEPVCRILRRLDELTFWALCRRREVDSTLTVLTEIPGILPMTKAIPHKQHALVGSKIGEVRGYVDMIKASAEAEAEEALREILSLRTGDSLGTYNSNTRKIRLHWVIIWICSVRLGVPLHDLVVKVLSHEYAHAYTHLGADHDGHVWKTETFIHASQFVKEGAAQFYSWKFCYELSGGMEFGPLGAFEHLNARQSGPYRCFRTWLPGNSRRFELVRNALTSYRCSNLLYYKDFLEILEAEKSKSRLTQNSPKTRSGRLAAEDNSSGESMSAIDDEDWPNNDEIRAMLPRVPEEFGHGSFGD